jgi:hypothetical protein
MPMDGRGCCSVLERQIDQHSFAFDLYNVTKRSVLMTFEVERNPAVSDSQIANVQVIQPGRQFWVN